MKRPIKSARGMAPVYRDVHPDKAPVELYDEEGKTLFRFDLDAELVAWVEKVAGKEKISFQEMMVVALQGGMRLLEEQPGDDWKK
jgi:hypothetical protein